MTAARAAAGLGVLVVALAAAALEPPAEAPEVISWPTSVGEVAFPHAMHAGDLGVECASCHHETHAARLAMPHADYFEDFWIDCDVCHGESASPGAPKACSACHHASPASIADETLSSKVVVHRSCWQCHEVGVGAAASQGCPTCHQPAAGRAAAAGGGGAASQEGGP